MESNYDDDLMEIDEKEGDAVYYHTKDCPNYCDYACNGRFGDTVASAYNAGRKAMSEQTRDAQLRIGADDAGQDWTCPNCGNGGRIIRYEIEQCDECGYPVQS